ncbi:MAG: hypothetical protein IKM29_03515 [Clostridia bacterium]|nr:hypothetical protein [Clostridia bacterium]
MITDHDRRRFLSARDEAIAREKTAGGIGVLNERTLHAAIKLYLEPSELCREVAIGRRTADIVGEDGIIEIQTRGFERLRKKLTEFLPAVRVTVVLPVCENRRIWHINPDDGTISGGRKSPVKGTPLSAFDELYKIHPFISNDNLTVRVMFLDVDDYRVPDKKHSRRGSVRYDRVPASLNSEIVINSENDLLQLLPTDLPDEFTSADLAKLGKVRQNIASRALTVLTKSGLTVRKGKRGRFYLYGLCSNEKNS